jgi:DNA-binding NtrC family response regulator
VDERSAIEDALRRAGGVRTRAAALLGMSRTTLWRKLRDYGIDPEG